MLDDRRTSALDAQDLARELARVNRVNEALVERIESATDFDGIDKSANNYRHLGFCIFETAVNWRSKERARATEVQSVVNRLANTLSDLAKAKEDAESAQRRLRNAIESINEGFAIFDANDRLALCNQTFLSLWPTIAARVIPGILYSDLVQMIGYSGTSLQTAAPARWVSERLEQRRHTSTTHVHALADGRWVQIDELRSNEGEIVVVCTDITKVKLDDAYQRAQELAEKSALLQATLDTIQAGVCVYDRNRTLTAWNSTFLSILGLADQNIGSVSTHERLLLKCFGDRDLQAPSILGWLAEGARATVDTWAISPNRTIEVRKALMPDGGMAISFDDVTYRVQAAKSLRQVNEELERRVQERTADLEAVNDKLQREVKERVAAEAALMAAKAIAEKLNTDKTRFLAAVSHDLLQPLNAARLFVSVLTNRRLSRGNKSLVNQTSSALDSVEEMLEALLEISRLDAKAFMPRMIDIDLDALLRGMLMEFAPFARQRGLELRGDTNGHWVRSDAQLLRRMLQNLISNALRYTREGQVRITTRRTRGHILIDVHDSGPGIARKDRKLIFREFSRLESARSVSGAGLGLAIVERAAKMLGCDITLKSRLGKGSTFGVSVPVGHANPVIPHGQGDEGAYLLAGLRILAVDNDAGSLGALVTLLTDWGCSVESGSDEKDALEALARLRHGPQVILADYHLDAGLRGDELVARLLAISGPGAKAIIITADRDEGLRDRLIGKGLHLLTKPLKPAKLRAMLQFLIGGGSDGMPRHL